MNKTAELITTGAELLSGRSVNTHAAFIGERLGRLGIVLDRDTTVRDDRATITSAIREAAARTDCVLLTGGLGPTNDDVTRDALAIWLGRRIVTDTEALDRLRAHMELAGLPMTAARERQALVLEGATVLQNAAGAAPGEWIEQDGTVYVLLPGPPSEMRVVWDDGVMPRLRQAMGDGLALRERVLLVHGLGEGDVVQRFEEAGIPSAGITTAYCAGAGRLEIRLHPADDTDDVRLDAEADRVAALLGDHVYARERVDLEVLVGQRLAARGRTLVTAESCTGGLIGKRLTAIDGSSAYYLGGIIAYADAAKTRHLQVAPDLLQREGAVSEAVARQMAEGARIALSADYSVAVTGVAGPSGGTPDKPVGLVFIAVGHPDGTDVYRHCFPGNRTVIREQTGRAALIHLLARL